ncbi:glycine-rich protein-like [Diospyros lotus]|uniref:glycine-rich protein-like n=1 Tax=Diospyros lotus TaxID=55363 RepID=UPI00225BF861|nr:glycine-rich protein-like [Diospyros lotus]
MGSKSLLLPGLLLACALLIASEVAAARELSAEAASTSKENSKKTNGVEEAQYGGGYRGDPGSLPKGYPGGNYCPYGCCSWNNYGGCGICCSYQGEPMDTGPEGKPHN